MKNFASVRLNKKWKIELNENLNDWTEYKFESLSQINNCQNLWQKNYIE